MPAKSGIDDASGYLVNVMVVMWLSIVRVLRSPSHSRRADAARRLSRRLLLLTTIVALLIIALMFVVDAPEIRLMPPRGTASLWPVKIITDFGKSTYVLWFLAALLLLAAIVIPIAQGRARTVLIGLGTRVQYIFLSVAIAVLVGEVVKGIVGRGRPFVGGHANPFNYSHFAWSEAYASFPSGHAITSFALAYAVSSVWPRLRLAMFVYATVIIASRLVLLAHHPSDVVGGALLGVLVAMIVRQWFAARRLGFTIRQDGEIVPLGGVTASDLKRVARGGFAPYEADSVNRR
jgi:undecaprenyl-diphosphatase